jgi:hypothetical protein
MEEKVWDVSENKIGSKERAEAGVVFNKTDLH